MPTLKRTPEAGAEVRRNLILSLGMPALVVIPVVAALANLLGPAVGPKGKEALVRFGLLIGLPWVSAIASSLILAYPLGRWPGFLRARKLASIYGIAPKDLSPRGPRRWNRQERYWWSFAAGAWVASIFVLPWVVATWLLNKNGFPASLVTPAALIVTISGGLSARSWVVRSILAEREAPTEPAPEGE